MANTAFFGSITTSGTSGAIRVEKAFFRNSPEFRQKAKVRADVIGYGRMLISLVDETPAEQMEDDPVVEAFLGFLAEDMQSNPKRMLPLSQDSVARVQELTKGVEVNDNEVLPEDVTF